MEIKKLVKLGVCAQKGGSTFDENIFFNENPGMFSFSCKSTEHGRKKERSLLA
jgi:hypothetical protein